VRWNPDRYKWQKRDFRLSRHWGKWQVFWDMAPYSLIVYCHFRGVYHLHFQSGVHDQTEAVRTSETPSTSTKLHGTVSQKAVVFKWGKVYVIYIFCHFLSYLFNFFGFIESVLFAWVTAANECKVTVNIWTTKTLSLVSDTGCMDTWLCGNV
jgi:hypothetical protein